MKYLGHMHLSGLGAQAAQHESLLVWLWKISAHHQTLLVRDTGNFCCGCAVVVMLLWLSCHCSQHALSIAVVIHMSCTQHFLWNCSLPYNALMVWWIENWFHGLFLLLSSNFENLKHESKQSSFLASKDLCILTPPANLPFSATRRLCSQRALWWTH